jgi:hypothetical protein
MAAPKINSDPSIQACAHALAAEAIEAVAQDLLAGVEFYRARDRAIETRADAWVSTYGKEAADAAVRALHMLERDEFLTPAERRTIRARQDEAHMVSMRLGGPIRDTWWNRLSVRLFGVPFAVLALALLAPLATPSDALAASGQHVAPKWRALAACGVAKPGPGRDRACRRFNSAERETWRAYDGPGAGAPREWELPRSYEIRD